MRSGSEFLRDVVTAIEKFLCKVHGTTNDHNYSPMLHLLSSNMDDSRSNYNVKCNDNNNNNNNNKDDSDGNSSMSDKNNVCIQDITNLLWTLLEELKDISDAADVFPQKMRHWMYERRPTREKETQTDARCATNDEKYVQVTCSNTELKRRIESFMQRKRAESDAFNRREFCTIATKPNEASCARTNAIYVPRQSNKSLLQIENIRNNTNHVEQRITAGRSMRTWHPTHPSSISTSSSSSLSSSSSSSLSSETLFGNIPSHLQERISNLNTVLSKGYDDDEDKLTCGTNVFAKIKDLESRVLFLETLSPEYFQQQHDHHPLTLQNKQNKNNKNSYTKGGAVRHCDIIQTGRTPSPTGCSDSKVDENVLLEMRIKHLQQKLMEKGKALKRQKMDVAG